MIPILCVDNQNGIFFHQRRQSRDRFVSTRILETAAGARLWMNAYSRRLFPEEAAGEITVDENFLEKAGRGAFCFVEGLPLRPWEERIEELHLYRWNRSYPADLWLDLRLDRPPWRLAGTEEFAGYSHERITKEIYLP